MYNAPRTKWSVYNTTWGLPELAVTRNNRVHALRQHISYRTRTKCWKFHSGPRHFQDQEIFKTKKSSYKTKELHWNVNVQHSKYTLGQTGIVNLESFFKLELFQDSRIKMHFLFFQALPLNLLVIGFIKFHTDQGLWNSGYLKSTCLWTTQQD